MPRLPDAASLGARPTPRAVRPIAQISPSDAAAMGRAVAGVGSQFGRLGEQIRVDAEREEAQESQLGEARARAALTRARLEARREFADDRDFDTLEDRWQQRMSTAADEAATYIDDPSERELFIENARNTLLDEQIRIESYVREGKREQRWGGVVQQIDDLRPLAVDAASLEDRAEILSTIGSMIDGAAAEGLIAPDAAVELKNRTSRDYISGWLDTLEPETRIEMLSRPTVQKWFDSDERKVFRQNAEDEIARREREAETEWSAYQREVGREVSSTVDLLRSGVMPAGLTETRTRAAGTEHEQELNLAVETFGALGTFPSLPLDEKRAELEAVRREIAGLSNEGQDAMQRQAELIQRRDMMQSIIDTDAGAIGDRSVLERFAETVSPLPPIDFTARSWAIRASHAGHAADHYGVEEVDLLTSDEADQFMAVLDEAPAEQRLAIMQEASTALDEAAARLWGQVADKRPDYARIGQLLVRGTDQRTVRDATLGADILARDDGKTIAMPTDLDRQYLLQQVAGEALHEAVPQEFVNGVMAVADGIYAARGRALGNVAAYDQARYRQALEEAFGEREDGTGGVGSVNGRRVLLPAGWTASEMNALIGDMTADAWEAGSLEGGMPVYGTGDPVEIDDLRAAELIAVNPLQGRFMVMTSGGVVLTPSGRPYVLDVDAALSVVEREQGAAGEQRRVIGERFPPGPGAR